MGYLSLHNNQLSGEIPNSICNLIENDCGISIYNNNFCPPYPECIEDYVGEQDTSECPPECDLGDVNCDTNLDILDVVTSIQLILADTYDGVADMNQDGQLDILDMVILINLIM